MHLAWINQSSSTSDISPPEISYHAQTQPPSSRTTRRPFDRNARISGSEWAETEERAGITWSKREMAERLSNMAIQPGDSTLEEVLSVWERRRSISKDDLCELMEYWTCEGLREEVGNHVVGIQMLHHDALGGNVQKTSLRYRHSLWTELVTSAFE
jgi:hypothetical protein